MKANDPAANRPIFAEPNKRPVAPPAARQAPSSARSNPVAAPRRTSAANASTPAIRRIQLRELDTAQTSPRRPRNRPRGKETTRFLAVERLDRAPALHDRGRRGAAA